MADVELVKVSKRFGRVDAIQAVDIDIAHGEFCCFVGPSGCGKSTLLRVIAGLEDVTDGEIRIGGERVNERPPAQRGIAMVFQSYALYPHMTVFDNMAFGLRQSRKSRMAIRDRVVEAASMLQITSLLDRRPRQLSGGQRQRVAIGRAIVRQPEVFLFDEPLSNLDASLRQQTRVEIAGLHARLGTTMIYVTHDQVEAMTLADRIVVLSDGRVEQIGAPLDLYHRPTNRFVAGFIGSPPMNFLPAVLASARPEHAELVLVGDTPQRAAVDASHLAAESRVTCGIRPEHVALKASENASLKGRAALCERLGDHSLVFVEIGNDCPLLVAKVAPGAEPSTGQPVGVGLPPEHCHLFDETGLAARRLSIDE